MNVVHIGTETGFADIDTCAPRIGRVPGLLPTQENLRFNRLSGVTTTILLYPMVHQTLVSFPARCHRSGELLPKGRAVANRTRIKRANAAILSECQARAEERQCQEDPRHVHKYLGAPQKRQYY